MQRLEVSGAVRHIYASLGFKGLMHEYGTIKIIYKTLQHQLSEAAALTPRYAFTPNTSCLLSRY